MKPRVHAAFMLLCDLTCSNMLPADQVKSTQAAIHANGITILPQLLCPSIVPDVPGQDDALIKFGK